MKLRRWISVLVMLFALFFVPTAIMRLTHPMVLPSNADQADAALIFGAVVRQSTISPLHRERLDAGITLLSEGKVKHLVVSNRAKAAQVMRDYLLGQGVDAARIEMDIAAERTPDTCEYEIAKAEPRSLIFVSQKFHLPRIALQCRLVGLKGQLVIADDQDRPSPGLATLIRVRGKRLFREAFLTWGALLGTYPE